MKEFAKEALSAIELEGSKRQPVEQIVKELLGSGKKVAEVYTQDPRNTDNAWIETVAYHYHVDSSYGVGKFTLHAGDGADGLQWKMVHSQLNLFASHRALLRVVAKRMNACW